MMYQKYRGNDIVSFSKDQQNSHVITVGINCNRTFLTTTTKNRALIHTFSDNSNTVTRKLNHYHK